MWGMMLLFGGGLALGKVVNGSGAGEAIAKLITDMHLTNDLAIVVVFVVFRRKGTQCCNSL